MPPMFSWFRLLFLAALLCHCADSPPRVPHLASLPPQWHEIAALPACPPTRELAQWWHHFEDASLTQIIADSLQANPNLAATRANILLARAQRLSATATLLPTLDASTSADRFRISRDALPDSNDTSYAGKLDASWEIDWFGKNRASLAAADADLAATVELFHATQASLASEVAAAYCALRVDESRLTVLEKILSSRRETYQLAEWRRQAGQADTLESTQALASMEQAAAGISSLHQAISQNRNLLAKLAGHPPGALNARLSTSSIIPNAPPSLAAQIPANTIRQRPDLREATWRCVAAAARSQSARAERFPSLKLSSSLGTSALGSGKIFSPQTITSDLIAGITGPIFDAGRIRARIGAQDASTLRELETYRSTLLNALSEVEDSSIACRLTRDRITSLTAAAQAARTAADLANQRYRAGVTDLTSVLDTQRSLLEIENTLLLARGDLLNAHIRLFKSVGGGWSRNQGVWASRPQAARKRNDYHTNPPCQALMLETEN